MKKTTLSISIFVIFALCFLAPTAQGATAKGTALANEILSKSSAPAQASTVPGVNFYQAPAATNAQLDALEKRLEKKINKVYDQINGKKGIKNGLAETNKHITDAEEKIDKVETNVKNIEEIQDSLVESNSENVDAIDQNTQDIEDLTGKVASIDTRLKKLAKDAFTELQGWVCAGVMTVIIVFAIFGVTWFFNRKKGENTTVVAAAPTP